MRGWEARRDVETSDIDLWFSGVLVFGVKVQCCRVWERVPVQGSGKKGHRDVGNQLSNFLVSGFLVPSEKVLG